MAFHHTSVLLWESIDALAIRPDGIYVDGTMGGGGHSMEIAKRLSGGRLIGFDQDANAIAASRERLAPFGDRVTYENRNFCDIKETLERLGIPAIDGALLDLGVSSHQLDEPARGFSYQHDAPLDMRMDSRNPVSAYDVVNGYSEEKLARVLWDYGEERWAKRIAQFIADARKSAPIQTTYELVDIIKKAVPKGARQDGPHPAKRTFQAIRIEVNGELTILDGAIRDFVEALKPGGRLAIITFHSLEDRIVKTVFSELAKGCTCPPTLPVCICGKTSAGRLVNRKPIVPGEDELATNPRARSAKLRVFEKGK